MVNAVVTDFADGQEIEAVRAIDAINFVFRQNRRFPRQTVESRGFLDRNG